METYMDNAATTKVGREVQDIMIKVMEEDYGNPSSKHTKGMDAEQYLDDARTIIADSLKCSVKNITFTSGGTEANNQAIIGTAFANERRGKHIISTVVEHASVHEPLAFLEGRGYEVTYIPVDERGMVIKEALVEAIRPDTILVSIMYVNNEVGSVQNIIELATIAKELNPNIIFHTDAIQAYGKYKINPKKMGVDLMSVSGHKLHGPKGTGFLYHGDNVKFLPYIYGGGQEKGIRSGTENVPGIAGLGVACRLAYEKYTEKQTSMKKLKQELINGLIDIEGASINANPENDSENGAPHIISASFEDVKSEVLLHALAGDGVYVSSGSACSSNHPGLSGTLKAIGIPDNLIDCAIRFSISSLTTKEDIDYTLQVLRKHIPILKKFKSY
ncbi:MAG: cysteine desulfurase [Lachnospiraceae bacterium]|nr:cysteine desulfurase [Lachnospiraceae bacterium]